MKRGLLMITRAVPSYPGAVTAVEPVGSVRGVSINGGP
jgi:hypothetical protein